MKTTIKTFAVFAMAAMMALSAPALAAETGLSYGVVDMSKVMNNTDAAKGIFGEVDVKRKEYQEQIAKEEEALRNAEQDIIKKKDSLSKEEFEKKKGEFESKLMQGQKMVMEKKKQLDESFGGAMLKLRKEAASIIREIAKEKGFSTVFTQDAIILSRDDLDITDEVIKRLNDKVKKIAVEWTPKKK